MVDGGGPGGALAAAGDQGSRIAVRGGVPRADDGVAGGQSVRGRRHRRLASHGRLRGPHQGQGRGTRSFHLRADPGHRDRGRGGIPTGRHPRRPALGAGRPCHLPAVDVRGGGVLRIHVRPAAVCDAAEPEVHVRQQHSRSEGPDHGCDPRRDGRRSRGRPAGDRAGGAGVRRIADAGLGRLWSSGRCAVSQP